MLLPWHGGDLIRNLNFYLIFLINIAFLMFLYYNIRKDRFERGDFIDRKGKKNI